MSSKLTDNQLAMLNAAARREDRCLNPSQNLKGAALQMVATKLISAGFAREAKASTGAPIWRRDEGAGQSYGLELTEAGAMAMGADERVLSDRDSYSAQAGEERAADAEAFAVEPSARAHTSAETPAARPAQSLSAPRKGTKVARLIEMLERKQGATPNELVVLTGWLPHTMRAALTGLRKRSYPVTLDHSDKDRGSTYFIRAAQIGDAGTDHDAADGPRSLLNAPPGKRNGEAPAPRAA